MDHLICALTADIPTVRAAQSCNQSSAEEVAQGLPRDLCARVCMYVCALHSMKCNTLLLSLKPLKKVWLYLKAWPGRETQTTVCSNISRQAAGYYEFYYCLGSDVFQEETIIKRFTLLSAVGGKNISYHGIETLIKTSGKICWLRGRLFNYTVIKHWHVHIGIVIITTVVVIVPILLCFYITHEAF